MILKPTLFITGICLSVTALGMFIPMLVDLYNGHEDWHVFFACLCVTGLLGGSLTLSNYDPHIELSQKHIFVAVVAGWVSVCLFSALPFKFSELDLHTADAIFESVSGLTTTGATVIDGLQDLPPGILIWRSVMQWIGGIGILLMALFIMPYLRIGGMQIFQTSTINHKNSRLRLKEQSINVFIVYCILTLLCGICFGFSGFGAFDAVAHAMSTISSGGFSTFDRSFIDNGGAGVQITAFIFMIFSGLPFLMILKCFQGQFQKFFSDTQILTYFAIIVITSLFLGVFLYANSPSPFFQSLWDAAFSVVSIMTGTGYAITNIETWGAFALITLFFLGFVGGCAGSTTCGIKIFRLQILHEITKVQLKKLLFPSAVLKARHNGFSISNDTIISVISFLLLYALIFAAGVLCLSFLEIDLQTSITSVGSAFANVGPAIHDVAGVTSTYAGFNDAVKYILCALMLLGRLEMFIVITLLTRTFWRR